MKRKILCLLLVCVLCLSGCQGADTENGTGPVSAQSPTTGTTTAPTTVPVTQPPHKHSYTLTTEGEPDCVTAGFREYTCSCGDRYCEEGEPALGHANVSTVVPPTAEAGGYIIHTCQRCGNTYSDSFVDPLPSGGQGTENPGEGGETETVNFFDDAAFVGDSVSKMLEYYEARYHVFGKATFLCKESYSVNNAVNNVMYLDYNGMSLPLQDALAACGAKKVFIMLGMNDVGLGNLDNTMAGWATLLSRIRAKNPDIQIYIQSATPIYASGERGYLTNANMDAYNARLRDFAAANGCYYIDVATYLKDDNNSLAKQYTSDYYVHLTYSACDVWASVLMSYVGA